MIPEEALITKLETISPQYHPSQAALNPTEADEFGYYTDVLNELMDDFARHLIAKLESEDTVDFFAIFKALDAFYSYSDDDMHKEFIVGLITCLKHLRFYCSGYPDQFCPFLTPDLLSEWHQVREEDAVAIFFRLCPSFKEAVETGVEDDSWTNEHGYPQFYLYLASFARHLIGMLERGETTTFPTIFQEVERLLSEGTYSVQQAMVIGLLEDLQNSGLYDTGDREEFRCYLGKKSEEGWNELYYFWGEGKMA